MRYLFYLFLLASALFIGLSTTSCKKIQGFSKGNLSFSEDTVVFDTVFTTIGSTTYRLKIYNEASSSLKIDEIELIGGPSSPFRINVDGAKGTNFSDLEMEKEDSLFIFVEVTLDINNGVLPMVVEDQIRFKTNGKDQYVQLVVWGQDMYYHNRDVTSGTWATDKPHLVYGYAGIDSATTLNIEAGTQIYMHKSALLYNYKGTLNINGTANNKVIIQGDRLEQYYQDKSGQFYGVYLEEARPSTIKHVEIKNGTAGIHVFGKAAGYSQPTLTLENSEIHNNSSYGIFIYAGGNVKAENCLIYKNEANALLVLESGDFDFNHCHLLGYKSAGQSPAVGVKNYFQPSGSNSTNVGSVNLGRLTNCVITGNQLTELILDTVQISGVTLNFDIQNCFILAEDIPTDNFYQNITWNENPFFNDINLNDFQFPSSSGLHLGASNSFPTTQDFSGNIRSGSPFDIGAWEIP